MPTTAMMLSGTAVSAPAVFPTTGLVISFDVNDTGNRTVSAGRIVTLTDPIAGNVLTCVHGGGTGPTVNTAALNGYDTMTFVAGSNMIWDLSATGMQGGDFSEFVVAGNFTGGGGVLSGVGSGGVDINANASAGHYRIGYATDSGGLGSTTEDWNAGWSIVLLTRVGTNYEMFRNGTSVLTGTTASPAAGGVICLGGSVRSSEIGGDVARAGMYNHALDATERSNFFGALSTQYGI